MDNLSGISRWVEGRVGATDAWTCLWKTRRSDNSSSSVPSEDDPGFTRSEAPTRRVTWLREPFHRWSPDPSANATLPTRHSCVSADGQAVTRQENEHWEMSLTIFRRYFGTFSVPLHIINSVEMCENRTWQQFCTSTRIQPDVGESSDKE